jgi:hypothetical protein
VLLNYHQHIFEEFFMSKLLIALSFLTSFHAFAHVLPGSYSGYDQNGDQCSFKVEEGIFENDVPHPLNERIPVSAVYFFIHNTKQTWSLGHPPVVDTTKGTARFNHDLFQQIVPTLTGAISVTLIKGEEKESGSAPKALIYIEDNYRISSLSKKLTCTL